MLYKVGEALLTISIFKTLIGKKFSRSYGRDRNQCCFDQDYLFDRCYKKNK